MTVFHLTRPVRLGLAATVAASSSVAYESPSVVSSGILPANTITTGSTASTAVTYGQPFKEGALSPADGLAGRQTNILTLWPDGSVKHALVTRVVSGSTSYSDTLTIGAAASGTALAIADLKAALSQPVAFDGGAFGTASFSGTDWDTPHTAVATGPLMSSWVHRKAFSGDSHLVAWVETRIFSTGAVEVFPWIENGYLTVATPTNKSATYTITMGGTLRFSEAIDIKHHTRVPLVSTSTSEGSATSFSHWLGSDPVAVPAHDGAYLRASKVIPNSYWAAPSGTALDAAQQTYTPNTLAGDTNATGGTGGAGAIISAPSAMYVNSGDLRAWKAMMAHALSAGSWSWHYRDSATNLPAAYASYATAQIGDGTIPAGTGGTVHSAGPAMTHMPSYAYLPFLVTGRWWFLEELQFQATWGFLSVSPSYRGNGTPAIDTGSGYTVRGGAWSMNLAAQAASATPSTHALSAQFVATWERTTALLYGKYVAGTISAGAWVSPLGVLGSYSGDVGQPTPWPPTTPGTAWWDAMYQHNYVAAVLGYSSDIGIAQSSTSLADHVAARNHSYKLVIGRADDGLSGRYNWRRFICFGAPIGTDATGLPLDAYYSTHAQMYAELLAGYSLTSLSANHGLSLKQHQSDTDLTSGVSSLTYGSTALAALAMAVDHAASGANEGWDRVAGASNFESSFSTYLSDEAPNWGIKPRVPAYIASLAPFEVRALTGTYAPTNGVATMLSATPSEWVSGDPGSGDLAAVITAWSGGAFGLGHFLDVHGGGHGDSANNGIYRFDFRGANAPTGWTVRGLSAIADVPPQVDNATAYYDGAAPSVHTYGGMVRVANGDIYRFNAGPWGTGGISGAGWKFPADGTAGSDWTQVFSNFGSGIIGGVGTPAIYDQVTNKIWLLATGQYQGKFFRCDDGTLSAVKNAASSLPMNGYSSGAWDASRGRGLYVGDELKTIALDFAAETATLNETPIAGSFSAITGKQSSLIYDELLDCYWVFGGGSAHALWTTIYRINASDFSITSSHTLTGDAITVGSQQGSYGRWVFNSAWRMIGTVAAHNAPAVVIRLPSS